MWTFVTEGEIPLPLEPNLREAGVPSLVVPIVPFRSTPVELPPGKVTCYGSTAFIRQCNRGVFYEKSRFSWWSLQNHYRHDVLLNNGVSMTVECFLKANFRDDREVFIRPVYEMKEFSGKLGTIRVLREWLQSQMGYYHGVTHETHMVVCAPQTILREFRVFMYRGKPRTGSQYRNNGKLQYLLCNPFDDHDLFEFATSIGKVWTPDDVFYLDVALTSDGYKIIETTCFNAAGFYACEGDIIVDCLNDYHETLGS